ncbi:alpha/beta fold hydrolase [Gilvimarinus polysaccharolyticus]|uniref:alpha/beta fold hydrolase n=1 Tax=Gilvimarinus polysaccharolyticus TaxID=863921 RepID=UPI0006731B53|nr:alpha/beta hydrolase [Gilvimarinus polysaccharolyticus]
MTPKQQQFEIAGLNYKAEQWGDETGRPVLALHGWLDNCASFTRLAAQLKGLNIIALDMAGHGQSDHRPGSAPYNIWDDVADVLAIADALGWQRFSLLGHSRGAIISALLAGAFPERIEKMVLIEGLFPEPVSSEDAPKQLAESIRKNRELADKPLRVFADLDAAVKARTRGMFPLSETAARALTERGTTPVAGGYSWSTDQRLLAPSSFKLTRGQIHAFISAITSPARVLLGDAGMPKIFPGFKEAALEYPQLEVISLAGGHHLHMEEQAETVASYINDFL